MYRPQNIADWRWRIAKAGLHQNQAAAQIGISATALSQILTGKVKPREITIARVEAFLQSKGV